MSGQNETFHGAIACLEKATEPDLELFEALFWHGRWQTLYNDHFREVLESSPAFAPLAVDLEGKVKTLLRRASENDGVGIHEAEKILGVPAQLFKAFLSCFKINDGEALLYLGNGHIVTFDFHNIMKRGVH